MEGESGKKKIRLRSLKVRQNFHTEHLSMSIIGKRDSHLGAISRTGSASAGWQT